jgi:hypothetical protein
VELSTEPSERVSQERKVKLMRPANPVVPEYEISGHQDGQHGTAFGETAYLGI